MSIKVAKSDSFSYSNITNKMLSNSLTSVGSFAGSLIQAPSCLEKKVDAVTKNAFASIKDAIKALICSATVLPGLICLLNNSVKFAGRSILALIGRITQVFVAALGLCSSTMSELNQRMNEFLNNYAGFSAFGKDLKGLFRSSLLTVPFGLFVLRGLDKSAELVSNLFKKAPETEPELKTVAKATLFLLGFENPSEELLKATAEFILVDNQRQNDEVLIDVTENLAEAAVDTDEKYAINVLRRNTEDLNGLVACEQAIQFITETTSIEAPSKKFIEHVEFYQNQIRACQRELADTEERLEITGKTQRAISDSEQTEDAVIECVMTGAKQLENLLQKSEQSFRDRVDLFLEDRLNLDLEKVTPEFRELVAKYISMEAECRQQDIPTDAFIKSVEERIDAIIESNSEKAKELTTELMFTQLFEEAQQKLEEALDHAFWNRQIN